MDRPRPVRGGGAILWLTGLSGAGKSTLAFELRGRFDRARRAVEVLDADQVRAHISRDLGFSKEDRDTNVARIAFVATLLARHGVVAIAAAISPYAGARLDARRRAHEAGVVFVEIYVDAPLDCLIARDPKGLYRRALAGEVNRFTGVSDPYEPPPAADVWLHTDRESIEESVDRIWSVLVERGVAEAPGGR